MKRYIKGTRRVKVYACIHVVARGCEEIVGTDTKKKRNREHPSGPSSGKKKKRAAKSICEKKYQSMGKKRRTEKRGPGKRSPTELRAEKTGSQGIPPNRGRGEKNRIKKRRSENWTKRGSRRTVKERQRCSGGGAAYGSGQAGNQAKRVSGRGTGLR